MNRCMAKRRRATCFLVSLISIWLTTMPIGAQTTTDAEQGKDDGAQKRLAASSSGKVLKLEEVVVSATRTEKRVDDAPASVTVITREDMKVMDIRKIDDALRHVGGAYTKRSKGIRETLPRISLRGLPGDERTLIMVNGIPVNDGYSNQAPWNQIPVDSVERIEVTRGPGSALYGGNAMGGVINIILREPEELTAKARAGYSWGDYENDGGVKNNYEEYSVGFYAADRFMDTFGLKVSYDAIWSDGYPTDLVTKSTSSGAGAVEGGYPIKSSRDSDYWVVGDKGDNEAGQWSLNIGGIYDTSDTGKINLDVTAGSHRYEYDRPHSYLEGGVFEGSADAYDDKKTSSISEKDFLKGKGEEETLISSLTCAETFGSADFTGKIGYWDKDKLYTSRNTSRSVEGGYDNRPGKLTESDVRTWTTDLQVDYPFGENHVTTFGIYYRNDDFKQGEHTLSYYRDEDSKTAKTGLTEGGADLYAAFVQHEWAVSDALSLYAGLRFDHWETSDGKSGDADAPKILNDSDDSNVSPKLSAVWHPFEDTYLKGGISHGFRPPNIYELYRTWTSSATGTTYNSNPDLDPETLWTYEAGVTQYLLNRMVKLGATAFYTDFEDYIDSRTIPRPGVPDKTDTIKDNVGSAEIKGIELEASAYPADWLKLWANWSYNDGEYKDWPEQPEAEGKQIADLPERIANVGAEFYYNWLTLSLSGNYTGRIYTDELNERIDDTYTTYSKRWLWDAKILASPHESVNLEFSVTNIFDEEYFDYYVGQPRTFFAGFTLKY